MDNVERLAEALTAAHREAHELIEKLTAKVDSIDPHTAGWGHVGDLNYYVEKLRQLVQE